MAQAVVTREVQHECIGRENYSGPNVNSAKRTDGCHDVQSPPHPMTDCPSGHVIVRIMSHSGTETAVRMVYL